jgi:hypothetical protein
MLYKENRKMLFRAQKTKKKKKERKKERNFAQIPT